MDSDMVIRIGPLEITGQARHRHSRYGFAIRDRGLSGWHDGVSSRAEVTSFEARPGAVVGEVQPEGRSITIGGPVLAPSQPELLAYRDQLRELFRSGVERMEVQHSGRTEWAEVMRLDQPTFTPWYYKARAEWGLQLFAPDPHIYGTPRRFTGSAASLPVHHEGSADAAATVTVYATSTMSGYGLRLLDDAGGTAGFLRMNALTSGQRHVIDTTEGIARAVSGALALGSLHSGAPWWVPPLGRFTVRVEPLSGAGRVESVELVDTYL